MPRARATDPQTSHDASDSVRHVTETQSFILRVLRKRPRTDSQLIEAYRNLKYAPLASDSGIRSRRAELVRSGQVADTGIKLMLPSGRNSIVWGIPNE